MGGPVRRLGLGRMAVLSVAKFPKNPQDLAQITECPSTMYGGPPPPLIVAKDSEILNNFRAPPAGAKMDSSEEDSYPRLWSGERVLRDSTDWPGIRHYLAKITDLRAPISETPSPNPNRG